MMTHTRITRVEKIEKLYKRFKGKMSGKFIVPTIARICKCDEDFVVDEIKRIEMVNKPFKSKFKVGQTVKTEVGYFADDHKTAKRMYEGKIEWIGPYFLVIKNQYGYRQCFRECEVSA